MQGRLVINSDEQRERARRMGVTDLDRKYDMSEMARGDVLFAATGVTDGNLLAGVTLRPARHHHPHRRHALVLGHGALDQGRAPGPRQVRRALSAAQPVSTATAREGRTMRPRRAIELWPCCASSIRTMARPRPARESPRLPRRRALARPAGAGVERLDAAGAAMRRWPSPSATSVPDIVARVLAGRGVGADEAPDFLDAER